jgi:hypothetical protein
VDLTVRANSRFTELLKLRSIAIFFTFLAVFFAYFPFFPNSLYSVVLSLFRVYDQRLAHDHASFAVHVFGLVSAVLLTVVSASYLTSVKRRFRVEELVALTFALQAFLAQASVSLSIQEYLLDWYGQGEPRVVLDWGQIILFVASVLFLASAYLLLTRRRRGRTFILNLLAYSTVGLAIYVVLAWIYQSGMSVFDSFLDISLLLLLANALSIYHLQISPHPPEEEAERPPVASSEKVNAAQQTVKSSDIRKSLNPEWVSRLFVAVFAILTVFFVTSPYTPSSLYFQALSALGAYSSPAVHDQVRIVVYVCGLLTGLVLIGFFVRIRSDHGRVEGLVAINCGLQAFMVQAWISLERQQYSSEWHPVLPGSGGNLADLIALILFLFTLLFLATAFVLLTHHRWATTFSQHVSMYALIGNIIVLIIGIALPYSTASFEYMLGVPLVMMLTSAMSIYFLRKSIRSKT